ncbi:MAG TPA: glycosyltransferase family 2 protein [Actinomycetales bacterium]|nr:glycosyltransferase family 2 protein [Actinomycetales bacterium]
MTLSISGPPHTSPGPGSGASTDPTAVTTWVTAVVVAHDGQPWLDRCLDAVLSQGANDVVAVDTGSRDQSAAQLRTALGDDHVVVTDRRTGFGDAARQGLALAAARTPEDVPPEDRWVWLLHDDCAPQPRALEALLDTAARSRHVGVVGPKLVDWDDPARLLEVGLTVNRSGRRCTRVEGAERDQGQHDDVTDVLALGSAGLLVRADVWEDLGGMDPALPLLRDDIDLGWRAHLAGYRVVLAPRALVADAQAGTRGLRSVDAVGGSVQRVDRVHGMRVALARASALGLLPLLCWTLLTGLARSLGLLAAKAPRRSLDELVATAVVVCTPWRWMGSRWRGRGTIRVRRRDIAQLLEPRLAGVRRAVDAVGVLAAAHDADDVDVAAEPGPTSDEADLVVVPRRLWMRRVLTHPLTVVVLVLATLTGVAWRDLLGRALGHPALTGGQLGHVTGRASDLWHAALGSWSGAGLGADAVTSPAGVVRAAAVTVLQPVAGGHAAGAAVLLLLLLAPVLAAVSAYLALTGFVRSRWVRAWAGLAWATLPLVATAVAGGRLGAVAALVLLPLVVAACARALAPGSRGSTTAAFAGALGATLLVAAAPALLVPLALGAVAGVLVGPGSARLRAAVLLVVPVGLLGPWLGALLDDPRRLLSGPGLLAATDVHHGSWLTTDALAPWQQLLRTPHGVPAWVAAAAVAPLALAGLVALLRRAPRGRVVLLLWLLGAAGLAAAVLAPSVVLTVTDSGGLGPWAGTPLLLVGLALIGSAALAVDGLGDRLSVHGFGWRQLLVAPVVALAVLGPAVSAGLWAWRGVSEPLAATSDTLPAVVRAAAEGPAGVRTLVLQPDATGALAFRLDGVEPGPWTRDLPLVDASARGDAEADPVGGVVRQLVDGSGAAATADGPVTRLGQLAVGFVLLRGDVPKGVVARLDSTAGLARIGAPTGSVLWRVGTGGLGAASGALPATDQERPARVRVEATSGAVLQTIPVNGAHASAAVTLLHLAPAGSSASSDRLLVLSQPASSRWRATLDGAPLTRAQPEHGAWRQAFVLPDRGGRLVVSYDRSDQHWWQVGQGVLAALCLLLALPVRRPSARHDAVTPPTGVGPQGPDEGDAECAEVTGDPTGGDLDPQPDDAPVDVRPAERAAADQRVDVPSLQLRTAVVDDAALAAATRRVPPTSESA